MNTSRLWHLRVDGTKILDGTLLVTGFVSVLAIAAQLI
jgi:hypothetical protein